MRQFAGFVIIMLCLSGFCQQNKRDSIYTELRKEQNDSVRAVLFNRLSKQFVINFAYDSAIAAANQSLKLSEKHHFINERAYALDVIGTVHLRQGDNNLAGIFYDSAMKIIKNRPKELLFYNINEHLGTVQYYKGNFDEALQLYTQSLNFFILKNYEHYLKSSYNNIGNVYGAIGRQHQKAIENYLASLAICKKTNDTEMMVSVCSNLGIEYGFLSEYDKAISYHNQSLALARRTGNKSGIATALSNLGTVYHLQQAYKKSIDMFVKAEALEEELGNRYNLANIICGISQGYLELKNYTLAREYGLKTLAIALETGNLDTQHVIYQSLARTEEEAGNYKPALTYYKNYIRVRDSLFNNETEKRILEIEMQNKFEREKAIAAIQRERKEAELVTQNKVKDLELWRTRLITGSVIALLVFVLSVALLIFRQRRLKSEKKAAQLEQKALRAQMNPHFLFNSLNSIQRLFIEGKKEAASDAIADFSSLLRRILNNSSLSFISLKEELDTLKLYMDVEKMRSDNGFTYEVEIEEGIDQTYLQVPPLVMQPFVENAIWHGILPAKAKGHITIRIGTSPDEEFLSCEICDNGVGINLDRLQNSESRGVKITEQRLGNLVKFEHLPEGGTRVTFLIPVVQ